MFIHLGGDFVIRSNELIAVFDVNIETSSKISKAFFMHANKENVLESIGEEEAKSIIVTKTKVYLSPISSTTIKKRAQQPAFIL
jgi:hypothetical protein